MLKNICFEAYPMNNDNINKMRRILVDKHGFEERQNHIGPYFYIEVNSSDSWQIRTILDRRKYKYRCYDNRYERNRNYRKAFFEHNKGPYHCAYCGKKLKASDVEVDHLIPISKAKSSFRVRTWLHICGILNVNDPRNLVASCERCNRKKSDKMGFWVIKGFLGRFKSVWVIRKIIIFLIIVITALFLLINFEIISELIQSILRTI